MDLPLALGFHGLGFEPLFAEISKPGLARGSQPSFRTERVGLLCACLLLKMNMLLKKDLAAFTTRELFHRKIVNTVQPERHEDLTPRWCREVQRRTFIYSHTELDLRYMSKLLK